MKKISILILSAFLICGGLVAQTNSTPVTLTNNAGEVFKDVRIIRADPDGLIYVFTQGLGGGKIKFTNLPPAIQAQYHFDPAKAIKSEEAKRLADIQFANSRAEGAALVAAQRLESFVRNKVDSQSWDAHLKVIQHTKTGLLVTESYGFDGVSDTMHLVGYITATPDDNEISCRCYHCGLYRYTTVLHTEKTIMEITPDKERAVRYYLTHTNMFQ